MRQTSIVSIHVVFLIIREFLGKITLTVRSYMRHTSGCKVKDIVFKNKIMWFNLITLF